MTHTCPECGALLSGDTSCQAIFDTFLVLEYTDPAYGEVHFLTVACFMIQHGRYSAEGLAWIEQKLRLYLEEGVPIRRIRRQASRETSQARRTWKIARQPGEVPLPKIAWSMTIADVAAQYKDAATYCELVKQWARSTLQEMGPLRNYL